MIIDESVIDEIFEGAKFQLSDILPSEWAEKNRFMTSEVSRMEGMYSFKNSPYVKEIADTFSPYHPAKVIAIMKGAQLGLSTGFIENVIGWIIAEQPGNIIFLVGHDDLVEKAMNKVDNMIDNTGIRSLIRSSANRAKNNKSGDKDRLKEFPGGYLMLGPTNHKTLRQVSMRYGFIDDFESMKGATKESGGTVPMIMQRFNTYAQTMKLAFISTPELEETSNIKPEYLKGDQRKFFVPCPCCGDFITIEWSTPSKAHEGQSAGMYWELDEENNLIESSVGYVCQECGGFFTDRRKTEMLQSGEWRPTAKPKNPDYTSYHISSLYGPTYMFGWAKYVRQFLEANPPGQLRNETLHQTFVNLVLGETYEQQGDTVDVSRIQQNIRPYAPWIIPESLSINDGNGRIVLLTLGSDLNGTAEDPKRGFDDDARFDYEVIAWSETGASYSVTHGSIGTFQPTGHRDLAYHNHPDRIKWSYKFGSQHCVWDELNRILALTFKTDTGRNLSIFSSAIDHGHLPEYVVPFVENSNFKLYMVKGDKMQNSGLQIDTDYRPFTISKDHSKLWILNVTRYKDLLYTHLNLIWNTQITPKQPADFLNFPTPQDGLYEKSNYFNHFQSEEKVIDDKSRRLVWRKKPGTQNHLWDCRIYGMAAKDLVCYEIFRELGIKNGTWKDYVDLVTGRA
jgi:phage terminase large subunit GpA-like protein